MGVACAFQIISLQRQLQAREQEAAQMTTERRRMMKGSEEREKGKGRRAQKVEAPLKENQGGEATVDTHMRGHPL